MLLSPTAMHIPDGFLSVVVSVLFWLFSLLAIAFSIKRVKQNLGEKEVPLMGVLAAAIFAGQMLNFTVIGGTSGHLLGAALATILVGPWAAILVMTAVVATQALLFQDGGLIVLGANLFNMAVVGVAVSYAVYRLIYQLFKGREVGIFIAGFIAAWSSIFIASLLVALQLALSGTFSADLAIPAMGGIHALIGIGEGLITIGALAVLFASRPDLLNISPAQAGNNRPILIAGILIALLLAVLSPLASSDPDGLEWVAEEYGFLQTAQEPLYQIIPDYVFPGVENEIVATILAGILGTLIVFGIAWGIAYARRAKATS